jgi:hypothetical protein
MCSTNRSPVCGLWELLAAALCLPAEGERQCQIEAPPDTILDSPPKKSRDPCRVTVQVEIEKRDSHKKKKKKKKRIFNNRHPLSNG